MAKQRHKIAQAAEIPVGEQRIVKIGRREIGLFNLDGTFHALPNLCPHQLGPLCEGKVSGTTDARAETGWQVEWVHEGEIVTCPWHGIEYHIPSGRCIAFPEINIRSYHVWEEDGWVMIEV